MPFVVHVAQVADLRHKPTLADGEYELALKRHAKLLGLAGEFFAPG